MTNDIVPDEDGPVGITDHELVALVDMGESPEGRLVLDAIGILPMSDDEPSLRAGFATLLVRDLAGIDEEMIVAQGFAGPIAAIMAGASEVLRMIISKDGQTATRTVFVRSDEGAFLLDMTMFGVHAAQPLDPAQELLGIVRDVVVGMAADPEALPLPFQVTVTRFGPSEEKWAVDIDVDAEDDWTIPAGVTSSINGSPDEVWRAARERLGYAAS